LLGRVTVIPLSTKIHKKFDMGETDPIYYGTHVLFFVVAAVLFGFFVKCLIDEVGIKGWKTNRALWACCLCLSSGVFVLNMLDPRAALGLYPPNILKLIDWVEVITLASSFAFTGYMYLVALYQRNMNAVPTHMRNAWLALMITFSLVHAVLSVIGVSTGNLYWFGVDGFILATHEILMTCFLNFSICKLSLYLHELNKEKETLGAPSSNFQTALRKMMYVRVGSIMMTIFAVGFQTVSPGSSVSKISKPFTPITYDNATFSIMNMISPCLITGLHVLILYMMRRPQSKSASSSEKTKESTPKLPSRTSRTTRPSTASSYVDLNAGMAEAPEDKIAVSIEAPEDVAKVAVPTNAPEDGAKVEVRTEAEVANMA